MAKILADRDIQKLLGIVILNGDPQRINSNGIEIRLGKHVLFQSTDEEKELGPGNYLKVLPGESVTISSFEDLVFTREAIQTVYPECDLIALITPTTTMPSHLRRDRPSSLENAQSTGKQVRFKYKLSSELFPSIFLSVAAAAKGLIVT